MQTRISCTSTTLSDLYRWSSSVFLPKIQNPPSSIISSTPLEGQDAEACRLARIMGFNNSINDVQAGGSNPREPQTTCDTIPLTAKIPPYSPFLQCRVDRTIPDGAYLNTTTPILRDVAIARPPRPEPTAPLLEIHCPIPIRAFKTAEFLPSERVLTAEEGHWSDGFLDSSPLLDRQQTTSPVVAQAPMYHLPTHHYPLSPSPSPVTPHLPSWPSSSLSLSIPDFDIYPTTPSPLDLAPTSYDPQHSRLFEYLSLTAPRPVDKCTKDAARDWLSHSFDPEWDSHWTEASSCGSTCSSGSFYSMSSASGSDMDLGTNYDYSPEPQYSSGSPSPSLSFSISATSTRCFSPQNQVAHVNDNVNEEKVGSFMPFSSNERKAGMGRAEWEGEDERVSERTYMGLYTKSLCEKLLGLGRLGRRAGEFPSHAGDAR